MSYTTEQLEAIALTLRAMPPIDKKKQQHNKQESIKLLVKEITLMQKNGYTLDQISEKLRGEGLDVATPTLKSCLQRARPVRKQPVIKVLKDPHTVQSAAAKSMQTQKDSSAALPGSSTL